MGDIDPSLQLNIPSSAFVGVGFQREIKNTFHYFKIPDRNAVNVLNRFIN